MTILIGYVPTPVGEAALDAGLAEAVVHREDVVILNSPRRGATVDANLVDERTGADLVARAAALGVSARVDHADHGADLVATVEVVGAIDATPDSSSSDCGAVPPLASWCSAATPSGSCWSPPCRCSRSSPLHERAHLEGRGHAGRVR